MAFETRADSTGCCFLFCFFTQMATFMKSWYLAGSPVRIFSTSLSIACLKPSTVVGDASPHEMDGKQRRIKTRRIRNLRMS